MSLKYVKTQSEFQGLIEANSKVIVNFTASWCGPCKMIAPKIEALAADLPSVLFVKVDIDDNEDTPTQFNVSAVPTFLFFHNGKKAGEVVGANADAVTKLAQKAAAA